MLRRTFVQNLIALGALTELGISESKPERDDLPANSGLAFDDLAANHATSISCAPKTLDELPLLPHRVSVYEFSSHSKKEDNKDGHGFLYTDDEGDAVVFDAMGPGCLRSFWQTSIAESQFLKFYFDGESQPRYVIRALDLYRGLNPLFPPPLTSYDVFGHWEGDKRAGNCFVPIPFAKSLKISIKGRLDYYHFFYERYPLGTPVATFTGKEDRDYLLRAFAHQGEELQPSPELKVIEITTAGLGPHESPECRLDLLKVETAGTIARVVLEGDATDEFLNQVEIEMQWDESQRPDVLAPIGMFCGAGVRAENVRSLPTRVELLPNQRVRLTSYFRMPFWRSAHVSLVNRQSKRTGPVTASIHLAPQRYPENDAAYFCALYHDGRTEMGRDWLFCDAVGTGWFVGVVQTMEGDHYCEGNEHFIMDGTGMPQIIGTGTEDYYLACFWPNYDFNLPFSGCVGDITRIPGPASYYRFHLDAPIPFYRSLDARIQHGANSNVVSNYRSLGFYYVRKSPLMHLTDLVDVSSEESERAHGYSAPGSKVTERVESAYEGNNSDVLVSDRGRIHDGGKISFEVATLPDNDGVRLRRRLDQNGPRQSADVYVDGAFSGTWYHSNQNSYSRWYDSEFELPAGLTRNKSALHMTLVVKEDPGYGPFTDFRYEILSIEGQEV